MAQRIKIDALLNVLTNLQHEKTEFEFIGITSNGIDCIYFVYEKGKFNFEYEVVVESQISYIEKIKDFAATNNYKSVVTTYNNQLQYQSDKPSPVIRIETNCSLEEATKLGEKIQADVFKNNSETFYDIVP